jgi:hypothetical protein
VFSRSEPAAHRHRGRQTTDPLKMTNRNLFKRDTILPLGVGVDESLQAIYKFWDITRWSLQHNPDVL